MRGMISGNIRRAEWCDYERGTTRMTYCRRVTTTCLAVCVVGATLVIAFLPKTPSIVQEIRAMPEVVRVDYSGPIDAKQVVVHLRDYHFVPRELCEIEGISFDEVLKVAATVQESQLAIGASL